MSSAENSHRQLNMASNPQPVFSYRVPQRFEPQASTFDPWFYNSESPLFARWTALTQHQYGHVSLAPAEWKPVQTGTIYTDPLNYYRYPFQGANYIYQRPFYATPTGACIMHGKCINGVAASSCNNFENDKANAFYSGKTCRDLKKILGPDYTGPSQKGDTCRGQRAPVGCLDW